MAKRPMYRSADDLILCVLMYEPSTGRPEVRAETAAKVKRRLRYHRLGPFDADRIDRLREFQAAANAEILQYERSQYWRGPQGPHAQIEDYDTSRMANELADVFPDIERLDIEHFIGFSIFNNYLR